MQHTHKTTFDAGYLIPIYVDEVLPGDSRTIPQIGDYMETTAPFLRTTYNYDRNEASDATALHCPEDTLAQQHFQEECDINTIVNKFLKTGEIPQTLETPQYGDYSGIFDFQTAMNAIRRAQENFDTLPAKIRNRFDNDPQKFLQFCEDPDNKDEAKKLGLLKDEPQPLTSAPGAPENAPAPKSDQKPQEPLK